jgi:hypothetical protein
VLAVLFLLEERFGQPKRPPPPPPLPPPEAVEDAPAEAFEFLFSQVGRKAETRCMAG